MVTGKILEKNSNLYLYYNWVLDHLMIELEMLLNNTTNCLSVKFSPVSNCRFSIVITFIKGIISDAAHHINTVKTETEQGFLYVSKNRLNSIYILQGNSGLKKDKEHDESKMKTEIDWYVGQLGLLSSVTDSADCWASDEMSWGRPIMNPRKYTWRQTETPPQHRHALHPRFHTISPWILENTAALALASDWWSLTVSRKKKWERRKRSEGELPGCSFEGQVPNMSQIRLWIQQLVSGLRL